MPYQLRKRTFETVCTMKGVFDTDIHETRRQGLLRYNLQTFTSFKIKLIYLLLPRT